jgi:hypothetical protein
MADVIGSSAVFDDGVSMPRRTGLAISDDPLFYVRRSRGLPG